MSTAEATAAPPAGSAGQLARAPGAVPGWLRLFRSELRLVFRRLRNLALLAALAALGLEDSREGSNRRAVALTAAASSLSRSAQKGGGAPAGCVGRGGSLAAAPGARR